jgi:nephrocystin-3
MNATSGPAMDWLSDIANWIRELVAGQSWLAALQLSAERTPDWALVATVPVVLATLLLLVFIMGPRGRRGPRAKRVKAQPAPIAQPAVTPGAAPTPRPAALPTSEDAGGTATAQPAAAPLDARVTGIPGEGDQDRGVRVFVSSTFLDMQGERDELVGTTFLDLRRQFRERGVELLEVDLRWGVTEQDVTLDVCLSEVNRCKPYFIGLLGQRYGTLLTDSELTPELLADFPVLRDGVGRSLTEIEILQGVLNDPDTAKHALFFERDPAWLDTLNQEQRASFEEQTEPARAKLADLKARIRGTAAIVREYKTPKDIGNAVKGALGAALEASFPQVEAPDAFTQTHRLHAAYARDRLGPHIGAELYLDRFDQWMGQADAPPLLITGASGGGKSKLIAKWLQAQRAKAGNDIMFAHYLGASPDSADPIQLMRRLWEHLNRATGDTVDLPGGNVELMDVASGLVERIAQAAAFAERNDCQILIALDGLDKLSSESDLRWLPSVLPPRVKLVTSSLDGEAKGAALARGWGAIEVKPLDATGQSAFIAVTLKLWGKSDLQPLRKQRILAHPLAGLPLFLKTVLEELRVSATNAVLDARLDDYLKAGDMPGLFARVLERLERDCGRALVERALSLIEASRAGLEEAEIIAITGATPLAWAKLRNGLGDSLRDQAGRIAVSHDYLRKAVEVRYLAEEADKRAVHLAIADRFAAREADERQAEELPYQLRAAQAWLRLEELLVDLDRFEVLSARGDEELLSYWLPLRHRGRDFEDLLCRAFEARARAPEKWILADIERAFQLDDFFRFAGATGEAHRRLGEQRTTACERLLGVEHPDTLKSMGNYALTLKASGDFNGAQQLEDKVLKASIRLLGTKHPDVLASMNNLAQTLNLSGDLEDSQKLLEQALDIANQVLGPTDPATLTIMSNLAETHSGRGLYEIAQELEEQVIDARTKLLGPEHPQTLRTINNLAHTLFVRGDAAGAKALQIHALDITKRVLGPEHPDTLARMSDLATTYATLGDLDAAQELQTSVLESRERLLGKDHLDTIESTNGLAGTLFYRGDFDQAQRLLQGALDARTQLLGPEHPNTLNTMNDLAGVLYAKGDLGDAKDLFQQALNAMRKVLGAEHPTTLITMRGLAKTLIALGDAEAAESIQRRVVETRESVFGSDHSDTIASMDALAEIRIARGDWDGAQLISERALEIMTHRLGPEHPEILNRTNNLAVTLRENGRNSEALRLLESVLEVRVRTAGDKNSATVTTRASIARTLNAMGRNDEALALMRVVLHQRTESLGADHPETKRAEAFVAQYAASMH